MKRVVRHIQGWIFTAPLASALILSCAIHGLFFGFFRISEWLPRVRIFQFETPSISIAAASSPDFSSSSIAMQEGSSISRTCAQLLSYGVDAAPCDLYASSRFNLSSWLSTDQASSLPAASSSAALPPMPPWERSGDEFPSNALLRAYPIRITLGYGLKNGQLSNDASELFGRMNDASLWLHHTFCSTALVVSFFVEVDPNSGAIVSWSCLKELVDKRLQAFAITILKTIRLSLDDAPLASLRGSIDIQFNGQFDAIRPYICQMRR